jgi:hypothetical protein
LRHEQIAGGGKLEGDPPPLPAPRSVSGVGAWSSAAGESKPMSSNLDGTISFERKG